VIGRAAAIGAVVIVAVVVAIIVLAGGSSYQVKAIFTDASQIVSGDQVQVSGNTIGTVSNVELTPNGQAALTLSIKDSLYQPLRKGTEATVRLTSLSGIANRYIDLRVGPGTAPKIPNNGTIPTVNTTSAVDLDEIFNTLNAPTRKGLQDVLQGSASQYKGQGAKMAAAWQYLNPAIASSSVLFREINRDTGKFTRFITKNASLVTDLASRTSALTGIVNNLSVDFNALAAQRANLGRTIDQLPGFMALANTTFVNLRNALDDLTPLVNASKPVAPRLNVFLQQLRPLAEQAVPTVTDLANVIRKPGANNDLVELTGLQPALAAAACGTNGNAAQCMGTLFANGAQRPAAFPISRKALDASSPELSVARPYAADLTGWFEGFTHPGTIDANGGSSRIANTLGGPQSLNGPQFNALTNLLPQLPVSQQVSALFKQLTTVNITSGQGDRCPGSMERGGVWYPESGFPCNPREVPTGP
jgi:phospholipid/cholesterol/gamma-HCH transport system substrate-binding protein